MAHGRARDERKEQQWRCWIGEWRASGLSVRAFCDRHGLVIPTFYAWRRTLDRRAAEKAAFVPVQVVADAVPTETSSPRTPVVVQEPPATTSAGAGRTRAPQRGQRPGSWVSEEGWNPEPQVLSRARPPSLPGDCQMSRTAERWSGGKGIIL